MNTAGVHSTTWHACTWLLRLQVTSLRSEPIVPQHSTHKNLSTVGTIFRRTVLGRIVRYPISTRYEDHRSGNSLTREDAIMSCKPSVSFSFPDPWITESLTCTRYHRLRQGTSLFSQKCLRALLHTLDTILVEFNRRTRRIQRPLNRTCSSGSSPLVQTTHTLAPRNLLKVSFEIVFHLHQPVILASSNI